MQNIIIGRYDNPEKTGGWAGWIEPEDRSWILFIAADGTTKFYPLRDDTGGVIE
jgi:hypothetical protein